MYFSLVFNSFALCDLVVSFGLLCLGLQELLRYVSLQFHQIWEIFNDLAPFFLGHNYLCVRHLDFVLQMLCLFFSILFLAVLHFGYLFVLLVFRLIDTPLGVICSCLSHVFFLSRYFLFFISRSSICVFLHLWSLSSPCLFSSTFMSIWSLFIVSSSRSLPVGRIVSVIWGLFLWIGSPPGYVLYFPASWLCYWMLDIVYFTLLKCWILLYSFKLCWTWA